MSEPPFADVVARAMRERGVTLRALCREVEVDASFFSKVLAGKRSPPAEEQVLRRIAAALGLDPAALVVSAGRIPSEWKAVYADPALFHAMNSLAASGGSPTSRPPSGNPLAAGASHARPQSQARPATPKREPAPVPVAVPVRKSSFGDELL